MDLNIYAQVFLSLLNSVYVQSLVQSKGYLSRDVSIGTSKTKSTIGSNNL